MLPVIDVRSADAFFRYHLEYSVNFPLDTIKDRRLELPPLEGCPPLIILSDDSAQLDQALSLFRSFEYPLATVHILADSPSWWDDARLAGRPITSGPSTHRLWRPSPLLAECVGQVEEALVSCSLPLTCLDVGCGQGRDVAYLALRRRETGSIDTQSCVETHQVRAGWRCVGIDNNERHLAHAYAFLERSALCLNNMRGYARGCRSVSLGLCAQVVLVPLNLRQYVSLLLGPRASADDGAAERVACAAGPPQCMLPSWEAYWPAALRVSSSLRNYIDPALQKKADARASPQMYSPPPPPLSPGRPASPQPANGPLASITAADGPSQRLGSTPKQSKAKSVVAPPSSPPPVQIWTRDLPAGTTPTALLPSASLVHVARFLNRTLLGILPHLVAPGGFVVYHHFLEGCERFGHPKHVSAMLRRGELRRIFSKFEILIDREDTLADGRPVANFVARRTLPASATPTGPPPPQPPPLPQTPGGAVPPRDAAALTFRDGSGTAEVR